MPKVRFTGFVGYQVGDWGVNLQDRWLSGYTQRTSYAQVYATQSRVHSWNTLDVSLDRRVKFDDDSVVDVYVSAQNVINTLPPLLPPTVVVPGLQYPVGLRNGSALGTLFHDRHKGVTSRRSVPNSPGVKACAP